MTKTSKHQLSKIQKYGLQIIFRNGSINSTSLKNEFKHIRKQQWKHYLSDVPLINHDISLKESTQLLLTLHERGYLTVLPKNTNTYVLTDKGKFWAQLSRVHKFKMIDGKPFVLKTHEYSHSDVSRSIKNLKHNFNFVRKFKKGRTTELYIHPNVDSIINHIFDETQQHENMEFKVKQLKSYIKSTVILTKQEKKHFTTMLNNKYRKHKSTHALQF